MVVYNDNLLIDLYGTIVHLSHADSSHILVIIDGADKHLGSGSGVSLGSGDIVEDGFKKRLHVFPRHVQIQSGGACLCGGIDERAVKLGIVRVQIKEQL